MEFIIKDIEKDKRIDNFISENIEKVSRSFAQKLIESNNVLVNGKSCKVSNKLKNGDIVNVSDDAFVEESSEVVAEQIPLDVLYEDEDIIVINKPKDMVVHPACGNYSGTLVNALLGKQENDQEELSNVGGSFRPGIIHRLDKDTTGALVIAKNNFAHENISKQIKERTTKKEYLALVKGIIKEDSGVIDMPIGRSLNDRKKMDVIKTGRNALTEFKVIDRFEEGYTLVSVILKTGRTHQIRVHFSHIGFPIVGDAVYSSGKNSFGVTSQMLHSHILGFVHPTKNEYMEFEAPIPDYFRSIINTLHKIK